MMVWLLAAMLAQAPPSTTVARPLKAKLHRGVPPTLSQIDAARQKAKARGLALAGVQVALDAKALSKGRWHKLTDGRSVWLLQVESPGAKALRVQFRDFAVGQGQLWVHAAGDLGSPFTGPFTGRGPHGDGEFWTDVVNAAKVTLEFVPEGGKPVKLPFGVRAISHQL